MLCTSATAEVQLESIKDKGIVTLNRPKALNALNLSMIRQIYPTMQSWEKNKCLVLMRGVGDKAFCAGGDVRAVTEAGKSGGSLTQEFFREEYQLNYLIGSFKIPYVAFIHGITMGGGVGLSVHGKYRVATEKTLFAMPETAIGLFPDVGGSYFLPRLQGKLGLYLALTGYRLKGSDVLNAGIATHICHSTNVAQLQQSLIDSDASQVDTVLEAFSAKTPELKSQEFSLKPVMNKINEAFSAKSVEEIISNLKKDESKWSQDTLNTLLKMSPTSLKVTFKQLELGATKDLKECLEMEYRMTQKFCAAHDFYEGKF
jgi:3-hydroxyisobutyryl-CoA hydrolase